MACMECQEAEDGLQAAVSTFSGADKSRTSPRNGALSGTSLANRNNGVRGRMCMTHRDVPPLVRREAVPGR